MAKLALQTALSLAEFQAEKEKKEVVTIRIAHLRQVVKLSASFKKYIASMHRNQSDSQIARREGLRNDSYGDPPSRPLRKNMFRNRYEEGEQDFIHIKARDRRKIDEREYFGEDERPRAPAKRTGKKPSRPVEEDDEEEEQPEEEGEERDPPARGSRKVIEHSEVDVDEDAGPKPRNRYGKSSLALNDRDEGEGEGTNARLSSKLAARSATKSYPRARNANYADTLPRAPATNSRRNAREVYGDEEEEYDDEDDDEEEDDEE